MATLKKFTLIELLVTTAQQNCFSKNKNETSSRPQGRTSRLPQANSSHLHIFTQSAFTLIELLVVIAIIAILAAMLLPALQQARTRAKTTSCGANFNTLGKYLQFYFSDYKGFFPYKKLAPANFFNRQTANSGWSAYSDLWYTKSSYEYLGGIRRGDDGKIYRNKLLCPEITERQLDLPDCDGPGPFANKPASPNVLFLSMNINRYLSGTEGAVKVDRIAKPAALLFMADGGGYGMTDYRCDYHPEHGEKKFVLGYRHNWSGWALFVDGHALLVKEHAYLCYKCTKRGWNGPLWNPIKPTTPY